MNFRKQNPRPSEQIMAPLPSARVPPADPPFTHVGVDHFGPLFAKQGHSQVKCYGCLFTCLTMREVHIEVLHTLEADSFIYAYQCFVSGRGKVQKDVRQQWHQLQGCKFISEKMEEGLLTRT